MADVRPRLDDSLLARHAHQRRGGRGRPGEAFRTLVAERLPHVYTLDEEGELRRYGFAFGTLPGHVEEGEERFTVEWNRGSGAVWYELFAFARPRPLLAKIGYPLVRLLQRRFAVDSSGGMKKAVGSARS